MRKEQTGKEISIHNTYMFSKLVLFSLRIILNKKSYIYHVDAFELPVNILFRCLFVFILFVYYHRPFYLLFVKIVKRIFFKNVFCHAVS